MFERACATGLQGAGVDSLLKFFDEVRAEYEAMPASMFNDDATYKNGVNQVRIPQGAWGSSGMMCVGRGRQVLDLKGALTTKQGLVLQLLCVSLSHAHNHPNTQAIPFV